MDTSNLTPPEEEHLALPPSLRSDFDKEFIRLERKFMDKRLFPYGEGVRLLLQSLSSGTISNDHWLLTLLKLLLDLQEAYEAELIEAGVKGHPTAQQEDAATEGAVAAILERLEDRPGRPGSGARAYQARVANWVSRIARAESKAKPPVPVLDTEGKQVTKDGKPQMIPAGQALLDQGIKIALAAYNEADASETIPAETLAEGTPPK